jgi:membrane fusion protein (multidrug efflux system)
MTSQATTMDPRAVTETARTAQPEVKPKKRTPLLIGGMTLAALGLSGAYYFATLGRESTDDATVEGRVMNVAARVTGQVLKVDVQDNQVVNVGDVLVELDPADYAAKADLARADLGAARASVEGARSALRMTEKTAPANLLQAQGGMTTASSSVGSARAAIDQARADIAAATSRKELAQLNFTRAKTLADEQAIPVAELDAKTTELDAASAALDQSRARLASAEAAFAGTNGGIVLAKGRLSAAETSAEQVDAARAALAFAEAKVGQAEAALKLAELNLSYTAVKALRRGVVSRRSVEEGQIVGPERSLFAIVPLDDVWVVANFKEDQLAHMHAGQAAKVSLDTYGRKEFRGHVESIAGGTGARFALLPPDNATGNFVKVVQRVPVLVRLEPELGFELRPGMSADVTVRVAE